MDETSSFNIQNKIQNGELLPPGFEDMTKLDEMKVHIALGQWMDKIQYDTIKSRANNVPKRFIGNLALNLFTEEVLKKSSITGKASNAHKSRKIKPALDATKLNAVYAHFEWWMRSKVHLSDDQISNHLKNVNDYIGKKIAELNRDPREYKRKKDSEGKKKSAKKFKSVEKIEEDNYKSDEDSQISPAGPSVDLMDPEENEEHIGTPSESLEEKEDDFEKKERTERESPERREDQELIIDQDEDQELIIVQESEDCSSRDTNKLDSDDSYDHIFSHVISAESKEDAGQ